MPAVCNVWNFENLVIENYPPKDGQVLLFEIWILEFAI